MDEEKHTYHTTGAAYVLPNDDAEHKRLELQSRAINSMMFDEPIQAPIDQPSRILEVGCGTGHMTSYLASRFPSADDVIGVDLSAVPPQATPSKATFIQGDFNQLTTDPRHPALSLNSFDYVFSRMLVYGITDWPAYIARAKSLLKPGGWLELQDLGFDHMDQDQRVVCDDWRWLKRLKAALLEKGLDVMAPKKLHIYMQDAGFEDVQVVQFRWIYGHWKGHPETDMIGAYAPKYLLPVQQVAYRKILGPRLPADELQADLDELAVSYAPTDDGKHKPFYVVWGRKPLA